MIDRGFIKWQPFNSLISNKEVLTSIKESKTNFTEPSGLILTIRHIKSANLT